MTASVILVLTLLNGSAGVAINDIGFYEVLGRDTMKTCEAAGEKWSKENSGPGRKAKYQCIRVQ